MRCRLTYLFLFFVFIGTAQDLVVDSLKLALKNAKHDTTRCNILAQLAETASDEEWPMFNAQLLKLAETKLSVTKQNSSEYVFYQKHLASALNNEGFLAHEKGNVPLAMKFWERSVEIQELIGEKAGMANSLNNMGAAYKQQGNIVKALEYYARSLKIREKIGDKRGIANSLVNMGRIYNEQGDIPRALLCYNRSLRIQEAMGDKFAVANTLFNFGIIYQYQGDIPKALDFYTNSLKIREEINDKKGIANSLNNIGLLYDRYELPASPSSAGPEKLHQVLKALEYYEKSLMMLEEVGDKVGVAILLSNIGGVFEHHGDPRHSSSPEKARGSDLDLALDFYKRSLKIQEETGEKKGYANSLYNIGSVYLKQLNYSNALDYFSRSLQLSRDLGYPENIRNAALGLSKTYKVKEKYQFALENYELYIQMRDSINNEENKKASIKSQLKYEYEKKAAADSVKVAEEKKVVQAQLKQEQVQRYSLLAGLALVLIFALIMVNRFRVTNKQKKLIEEQKKVVEEQKDIVDQKQKEILDSIHYAKRIQTALITNEYYIHQNLKRWKG